MKSYESIDIWFSYSIKYKLVEYFLPKIRVGINWHNTLFTTNICNLYDINGGVHWAVVVPRQWIQTKTTTTSISIMTTERVRERNNCRWSCSSSYNPSEWILGSDNRCSCCFCAYIQKHLDTRLREWQLKWAEEVVARRANSRKPPRNFFCRPVVALSPRPNKPIFSIAPLPPL